MSPNAAARVPVGWPGLGLRRGFIPGVPVPRFAIPDRHGPVFSERFSPNATGLQPPYRFSPGEAVAAKRSAPQGAGPDDQPPDETPKGRRLCGGRMRDGGPVRSRFSDEVEDLDPVVEQAAPKGHSSQAKSPALLGQHTSSLTRVARSSPDRYTQFWLAAAEADVERVHGLVHGEVGRGGSSLFFQAHTVSPLTTPGLG